ncbi:VIT1/CCC1 transporter family protein [Cytophagales bacterium LB-30]|uniref:VIT1/CCC1 transporter family protein n=1 Tax=Shiella aurantiaca TaxID=3058365 RepID=A0ABT8F2Q9_9BACT|nr:VIT1/CCC1 transporter family protein [Shiella aurantiaca]MDN4164331.1 VIT1/CCC1 transporter family protein [Shiella aurantiaca]
MNEGHIHADNKWLIFDKGDISEFVYGGIDGAITTFAVVAGAAGADAGVTWVLIFGFANLIADGFSMSVGNYFSSKADRDNYERHKAIEYWEIEHLREKEVQEIREIYEAKGFKGELLEQVVAVITSNKDVWVDTMMKEELEMTKDSKTPLRTASVTFLSFFAVGLIPLLIYVLAVWVVVDESWLFPLSCASTGLALLIIGNLKSVVTETNRWKSIAETLALGGLAAFLAYYVGEVLAKYFL